MYAATIAEMDLNDAPNGVVLSKSVPAGSYVIAANYTVQNMDDDDETSAGCDIYAGATHVGSPYHQRTWLPEADPLPVNAEETGALNGVVANFAGGDIRLVCGYNGGERTDVHTVSLTATKVAEVL